MPPEIKEKARATLARAGQRAASLAAAAEARRYFTQAAELAADPSERAALLGQAGEMARRAADPDAARALLAESIELYEQQGDTHAAARGLARLGDLDAFTGPARQGAGQDGAGFLPSSRETSPTRISRCSRRGCLARTGSAEISSVRPSGPSSLSTSPSPMPTPSPSPWRCAARRRSSSAGATPQEANALLRQALQIAVDNDLAEDAAVVLLPALRRTLPVGRVRGGARLPRRGARPLPQAG